MKQLTALPRPTGAHLPPGERIPATLAWLGTFGAVLTVAGVHYPGRTLFTLVFLMVTPVVCFAQLLTGLDPLARIVISIVGGISLISVVAEVMLAAGWWTPRGGLITVGVLCGLLLAVAMTRRPRTAAPPPQTPAPVASPQASAARPASRDDEDAWLYEE
ncbi:MAG TPA: hypothetical protein VH912_21105 [Streptosporangiaceae bacterium]